MRKPYGKATHHLACLLAAGKVDKAHGVITGCTVAMSGVQATGKVVLLDKNGAVTRDEKLGVKKLPVFTDGETLTTLMAAAAAAGKRVKTREDHDDSIGARAGFASEFLLTDDGRVTADIHLFESYRNRDVVMDTAEATPDKIGLSIDMDPRFDVVDGRAMMRIIKLHAVDIVDEGAITPRGLLFSAGVDSPENSDPSNPSNQPNTPMPDPKPGPTNEEILTSLGALTKTVGEMMAQMTALQKGASTATDAAATASAAEMKALRDVSEKLSLAVTAQGDQLKIIVTDNAKMKRERALLGFNGTPSELAKLGSATAEEIEKVTTERKTYLQLVADHAVSMKCAKSAAHAAVQRTTEGKAAYELHLASKGIVNMAA